MSAIAGLPALTVQLADSALAPGDAGALEEVHVRQHLSLPAQCELTFLNPQGRLADALIMPAAEPLKVMVQGCLEPLFVGEVTAVEHAFTASRGHEVYVRGYDVLHRLRKQQPLKAHVDLSLPQLARELVSALGLSVEGAGGNLSLPRIIQHRQSDLELLHQVVERCGLYFTLRGTVLQLTALQGIGDAVPLALGDTLLELRIEANSDGASRSVKASTWDPWKVEAHSGSASVPRVGRDVTAEFPPSSFGLSAERTLTAEVTQDDNQAEALAQGELDRRVAGEVTLWGVAEGNPLLRPACPVDVSGISSALSGRYVLTSVNHKVDRRAGFTSEISSAPPAPSARSHQSGATLGIVVSVDDPESRGRVRASLPALGNLETDWMSVVCAGAGESKGLLILPDVGDRVLVLFLNGDSAQGMVVGGLFGGSKLPDACVEGGSVRRYTLATAKGQKIQFDDTGQRIRLENSQGSCLEISPDLVLIHARTKLRIEAVEEAVVIRGKSIDFERG